MSNNWLCFIVVMAVIIFSCDEAHAKRLHPEAHYQEIWCEYIGEVEVILDDDTRVDCLTDTHAIEFDFANKWAEAIGQSLHYSVMTGKRAGIVIIVEDIQKDSKYIWRLFNIIAKKNLSIDICGTRPDKYFQSCPNMRKEL